MKRKKYQGGGKISPDFLTKPKKMLHPISGKPILVDPNEYVIRNLQGESVDTEGIPIIFENEGIHGEPQFTKNFLGRNDLIGGINQENVFLKTLIKDREQRLAHFINDPRTKDKLSKFTKLPGKTTSHRTEALLQEVPLNIEPEMVLTDQGALSGEVQYIETDADSIANSGRQVTKFTINAATGDRSTVDHELSHKSDLGGSLIPALETKRIRQLLNKPSSSVERYLSNSTEVRARVLSSRSVIEDMGIGEMETNLTPKQLDKVFEYINSKQDKSDAIDNNLTGFKDLMQISKGKTNKEKKANLLKLLNEIVSNEQPQDETIQAANYGGELMKRKKYNLGGQIGQVAGGLAPLAGLIPGAGLPISAGLSAVSAIAPMLGRETPQPVVPTRNSGNFQGGGDINVAPGLIKIQGNPSEIDGERRTVQGTPVQLSHDELISVDQNGAHAYSSARDMLHPKTGRTFADTLEPILKGRGKAERNLKKNPTDAFAKNTIQATNKVEEANQQLQAKMRDLTGKNNPQQELQQRMGGAGLAPPLEYQGGGFVPPQGGFTQDSYGRPLDGSGQQGIGLTLGDKIGLAGSGVELAGKAFQAFQPARKQTPLLNTAPISRQQFSAAEQLRQNQRQFTSQVSNINSSSFSTNNALRQAAYASKLGADSTALFNNQLANQQARVDYEERLGRREDINNQARFATQQINAAASDKRQTNIDTLLTSTGNVLRGFGTAKNIQSMNNVTLDTLNSLSEQYGIDVDTLNKIIQGLPNSGTTSFKNQG